MVACFGPFGLLGLFGQFDWFYLSWSHHLLCYKVEIFAELFWIIFHGLTGFAKIVDRVFFSFGLDLVGFGLVWIGLVAFFDQFELFALFTFFPLGFAVL